MWFIDQIVELFLYCYEFTLTIAYYAGYIPIVGDWLEDRFQHLANAFGTIALRFYEFGEWLDDLWEKVKDVLTWEGIQKLIRGWLDGIEDALDWFKEWWDYVLTTVNTWWEAVQDTVKGWIAIAVQGLDDLIEAWDNFWKVTWPEWTGKLTELKATWDNFWETIFPTLVSFAWLEEWWNSTSKDIEKLIEDTIKVWFPFYDDLVNLWESIKVFFADPLQWTYDKLDEWFERFW